MQMNTYKNGNVQFFGVFYSEASANQVPLLVLEIISFSHKAIFPTVSFFYHPKPNRTYNRTNIP